MYPISPIPVFHIQCGSLVWHTVWQSWREGWWSNHLQSLSRLYTINSAPWFHLLFTVKNLKKCQITLVLMRYYKWCPPSPSINHLGFHIVGFSGGASCAHQLAKRHWIGFKRIFQWFAIILLWHFDFTRNMHKKNIAGKFRKEIFFPMEQAPEAGGCATGDGGDRGYRGYRGHRGHRGRRGRRADWVNSF